MDQDDRRHTLVHRSVQIRLFPAAYRLDEVRPVIAAAGRWRGSGFLLFAQKNLEPVRRAEVTLRSINDVPHDIGLAPWGAARHDTCLAVRHPVTDLEDEHLLFAAFIELETCSHGIGRLLVVVEQEVPADRADLCRILHAEQPPRRIDLVHTLVAEVAVAVIPEPVKIVMESISRKVSPWRRAEPEIVVHSGGDRLDGRPADRVPPLVAKSTRQVHVTDYTLPDPPNRFLHYRRRAAIGSVLYHPAVFLRRREKLPGFEDVVGAWLLDVDVLAGLTSPDRLQGMVVVRRGDRNGINRFVLQNLA